MYSDLCQDHDNASFIHVPLIYPSVYPLLNLWTSDLPEANTRKRNTDCCKRTALSNDITLLYVK